MGSSIKIGFAGSYKCDLLLYMARVAAAAGKNVMVADATDEQLLNYSMPDGLDDSIINYCRCDILPGCGCSGAYGQLEFDKYDIVLIDYGFNKSLLHQAKNCNVLIVVSDFERYNVLKLRDCFREAFGTSQEIEIETSQQNQGEEYGQAMNAPKMNVVKIYRDVVNSKINSDYIDHLLDIDDMSNVTGGYLFYLDDTDHRLRLESQYNDNFHFNKLSKEYKLMFSDILQPYLNIDAKELNKVIKKAERGV